MKNLIGKNVKGFKFDSTRKTPYFTIMDKHIGEVGRINGFNEEEGSYMVEFELDFWHYPEEDIKKHLVCDFKRGDIVLVRDDYHGKWNEAIFLAEVEGSVAPFVCVTDGYEETFLENKNFTHASWEQIKPIEEKTEVTLEQIAKKFGVEVENLKIKK